MAPVFVSVIGLLLAANVDETDKVLRNLKQTNEAIMKAASLAQQRSGRDDVRAFARRLQMDHGFAHQSVLALAKELALRPSHRAGTPAPALLAAPDPKSEEAKHLAELGERVTELEARRGPEFDLAFLRLMRLANLHAIDTLTSAERRVSPGVVRALERLIPIFEQHVELAVHLSGSSEARAEAED